MFSTLLNIFRIPELRNKVLFTLAMLAVYRIGYAIPLPGVNQELLASKYSGEGTVAQIAQTFAMFSGGNLSQSTVFGLGVMPYISASIIMQLLATVVPALEKLQKEGQIGYKKIQEYSRYAAVLLSIFQSFIWLNMLWSSGGENSLVYPDCRNAMFWIVGVFALTSASLFLMWIGEQIDEYGIGNGVSLIISAGIISGLPSAIVTIFRQGELGEGDGSTSGFAKFATLAVLFILVVAGAIFITQAQRRIPIQQAKQMRGRRMMMGSRNYLPLRVNHGGVMPIIFASSIMIFPTMIFQWLEQYSQWSFFRIISDGLSRTSFLYIAMYVGMVYFFAYFWTTVQFKPKDISNQLRDYGSFVPGLRPGKRTSDYLETVMERITYVGAGFLSLIALLPSIVSDWMSIPYAVSAFLGGTGLLIVVSVTLDFVQRVEAQLAMRNYSGFLGGEGGEGPRIRGAYGG